MLNNKEKQQFPVVIKEEEDGSYFVSCPLFDGCFSQGDTIDEALKNIKEAISLCLDEIKEKHQSADLAKQVSLHLVTI